MKPTTIMYLHESQKFSFLRNAYESLDYIKNRHIVMH